MAGPEAVESRVRSMLGGAPAMEPAEQPDADDPSGEVDAEAMTLEAGAADFKAASDAGDTGGMARAFRSMFEALMRPSDDE